MESDRLFSGLVLLLKRGKIISRVVVRCDSAGYPKKIAMIRSMLAYIVMFLWGLSNCIFNSPASATDTEIQQSIQVKTASNLSVKECYVTVADDNSGTPYLLLVQFATAPECVVPVHRTGYITGWSFEQQRLKEAGYPTLRLYPCADKKRCFLENNDWLGFSQMSLAEACNFNVSVDPSNWWHKENLTCLTKMGIVKEGEPLPTGTSEVLRKQPSRPK